MAPLRPALIETYARLVSLLNLGQPAALLAARLLLARAFLLSGLTKWNGLSIKDTTFDLFRTEFFGRYNLPNGLVDTFAVASSVGEIILPILLIVGLGSRLAALGVLAMTAVIQLFVYPDAWWTVHAWWMVAALAVVTFGPGAWSVDRLLKIDR